MTVREPAVRAPTRVAGYAPLRDYAVIGDGRTVGLVARDGAVDWLPWPDLHSPSVFAAVLDATRGGCVRLEPEVPYSVSRSYLPETNVLRTSFTTALGTVAVTDALTLSDHASLVPARELVRQVEGLSGAVPLGWRVEPRFGYGARTARLGSRDAVMRSALALKLLVFAPSAALAAAGTTSLPERMHGPRNWDYRYCWIRDSAFTLDAFLQLDCVDEPVGFFWWMMHASQLTHPRLRVLYALDGGAHTPEKTLPLHGYRGSAPVRVGNAAIDQVQLDTYGELMQTAWLYATGGHPLDRDVAGRLAEIADHVCRTWRQPDAGIWEVRSAPEQFTQSKMMCWVALDRALDLAERGLVPGRHAARWRRERDTIAEYVETRCFNPDLNSYVRAADGTDLDASLLLGVLHGYRPSDPGRFDGMIDAVQRLLRRGPYVYRYVSPDGLPHEDGAFLACSFWLAEALARRGRVAEAVPLMDRLVALANDVGLYSEEIVPETGEFLGNLPQGLSHLARSAPRAPSRRRRR